MEEVKPLAEIITKKPRSEKQIEAFKKARENRMSKIEINNTEKKRLLEEKILSKALSIKKKQIKKEYVKGYDLDSISDDETPIEEIKKHIGGTTTPFIRAMTPIKNRMELPVSIRPVSPLKGDAPTVLKALPIPLKRVYSFV